MNRLAIEYLGDAIELEAQNRELRRINSVLLVWIAEHEDLMAFARAVIDARFPQQQERAA